MHQSIRNLMTTCATKPLRLRSLIIALAIAVMSAPAIADDALETKRAGEGATTLILVHGFGMTNEVWTEFMERNTTEFTMIAPTLRGFGGTPAPSAAPAIDGSTPLIDAAVADVAAIAKENAGDALIVVGQGSLGGFIAARVGIDHPDIVTGVVAVDAYLPAMPIGSSVIEGADRLEAVQQFGGVLEQVSNSQWISFREGIQNAEEMISDPARVAEIEAMMSDAPRDVLQTYLLEMMVTDLRDDMGRLKAPLLCIFAWPGSMTSEMAETKKLCMTMLGRSTKAQIVTAVGSRQLIMFDRAEGFDNSIKTFAEGGTVDVVMQ